MANTRQTNTNNFDYKATKENPQAFQCGGVSNAGKFLRVGTNGYVILSDGSGAEPNKYVKDIHKKGDTAIDITQVTDGVEELISFEPDFTKTTVSATGTATDIVYYITVGDTEYKLPTVSGDYIAKVDGVGTGTTSLENLTIDGDLLGKADSVVDFSLSADVDLGTNAYCSMLATPNLTSVTNVDYVNTHFIKLLPLETYSHEPYHFPFHFSNLVYTPATKKLTGTLHTITLDNNKTITQYPLEVELPIPELADNLTTTITGKALDANQGNVLANGLALEIQNRTDADQELEDNKQDKLPTPVAGKYLKSNSSTGDIEWADGVDTTNFVTTNTAQSITGQKTFTSDILLGTNTGIKKLTNTGSLAIWSSNNNYAGASLYMYGTAGGGSEDRGTFNLSSCDGSTKHSLIGSLDGALTWKGNDISGNVTSYTINTGSGTNITVYRKQCYKIGRMVFVSISGKNNTEIPEYGTSTAIFTGLPAPVALTDIGVFYFDRTTPRGTRFRLNTSGQIVTDSEGFEANYFTFNFSYVSAS